MMTFQEAQLFLRYHGVTIKRMADGGDLNAKRVIETYQAFFRSQLDVRLQDEMIVAVKDFAERIMTLTELDDLERRYGVDHPFKSVFRGGIE